MPPKAKTIASTVETQPVDNLQLQQLVVEWVPRKTLRTNIYNPNRMTSQDRALLRQSILEDGWTQPIVTLLDGTIVDGEQRWTVAGGPIAVADIDAIVAKMTERQAQGYLISESILGRLATSRARLVAFEAEGTRATLADITGTLVPITRVDFTDDAHKMIATIRHNRARGTHQLDAMAAITQDLQQLGLDFADLEVRLGMLPDEIERLIETVPLSDIQEEIALSPSWEPVAVSALSTQQLLDDDKAELARSRSESAAAEGLAYSRTLQRLAQERKALIQKRIQEEETTRGTSLTEPEKTALHIEVEQSLPDPLKPPKPAQLQKFVFFVTMEEFEFCKAVLGDPPVQGFLALCRAAAEHAEMVSVTL